VLRIIRPCHWHKMWHVVTNVSWSVCLCFCLLVTTMSCTKTAELIEMSFRVWTQVGPMNHVLDGGWDPPWEEAI